MYLYFMMFIVYDTPLTITDKWFKIEVSYWMLSIVYFRLEIWLCYHVIGKFKKI